MVRLAIIFTNRLIRECLVSGLKTKDGLEILTLEHDDQRLLDVLRDERPDIALVDLGLPGSLGVDLVRFANECDWEMKTIIVVSAATQDKMVECIAAGAHAWLHGDSSLDELHQAIDDVCNGRAFYCCQVVHSVFGQFARLAQDAGGRSHSTSPSLTQRELEVLDLIAERLSNKEIAKRLCVSPYTVKNHVHNILEKLRQSSRHDAVEYAPAERYWLRRFR